MDLDRTPVTMASAAAEEIRALNHRTLDTGVFAQSGDVSDTANALSVLLERLPQAFQQLESGLVQLEMGNRIRLDTKPLGATTEQDIRHEVATVTSALTEARNLIQQAHQSMREATGPLSHMGGLWDDDGEEGQDQG